MASLVPTAFDGLALGYSGNYGALFEANGRYDVAVSIELAPRRSFWPSVSGHTRDAITRQMVVFKPRDSAVSDAVFNATVKQTFDPGRNHAGPRYLVGTGDDGVTALRLPCYVQSLAPRPDAINVYDVTLVSPQPFFEANSATTSAADPATVTNAGNVAVAPIIQLTTTTHVSRLACTVSGAGVGGGLLAYPVRFAIQPVTAISSSGSFTNPILITTTSAHGLTTGDNVTISGHSIAGVNGTWTVTVISEAVFTVPYNNSGGVGGTGGTVIKTALIMATTPTASNTYVFVEGVSVPTLLTNDGSGNIAVWALIDTAADGSATQVDIVTGAGLSNPLGGTLDDGARDTAASTNTSWVWNDWSILNDPQFGGTWRPALAGNHNRTSNASHAITSSGTGAVKVELGADGVYDDSADSIVMATGGSACSGSLTGLSRQTSNLDGTNAQAFIRTRGAGSAIWSTAWSTRANATVSTAISVNGAAEVVVGLENDGATADPASVVLSGAGVTVALSSTPTVTVGAPENFDLYDGTYVVGGYTLTFEEVMVDDGTLTIDCGARTITHATGPLYGAIRFSDPAIWALLATGSNTITDGLSASDVIVFRSGYA